MMVGNLTRLCDLHIHFQVWVKNHTHVSHWHHMCDLILTHMNKWCMFTRSSCSLLPTIKNSILLSFTISMLVMCNGMVSGLLIWLLLSCVLFCYFELERMSRCKRALYWASFGFAPTTFTVVPVIQKCWTKGLKTPLLWRHNGRGSVWNHQPHVCLLKCLFRRRSKKTSKLRVTGLCAGNSPGTGEFPAQMASNAENVSIW